MSASFWFHICPHLLSFPLSSSLLCVLDAVINSSSLSSSPLLSLKPNQNKPSLSRLNCDMPSHYLEVRQPNHHHPLFLFLFTEKLGRTLEREALNGAPSLFGHRIFRRGSSEPTRCSCSGGLAKQSPKNRNKE